MRSPQAIGPFPKGTNTFDPPGSIERDQLASCTNWNLDPFGILYKRPGSIAYGNAPAKLSGNFPFRFLRRYYKPSAGLKQLIGIANGIIAAGNDTTGAWTPIAPPGGWSGAVNNLHDSFIYKGRLYILGGTYPVRYDGTNLLATGHFLHNSTGWVATPGAGVIPDGTYKYIITSVQGDLGEGGYSTVNGIKTVVLAGGPHNVAFTVIDVAPGSAGATNKQVWRTHKDGSIFFKLPDGLIAAGATTYTDNNLDTALTEEYVSVSPPPTDAIYAIVGADDRVYYFGMGSGNESIVQVSDVGFPDRIVDNLFFSVSAGDGHKVIGAGLVPNGIAFLKQDSMWMWQGVGFGIEIIKPKIGCRARFSIVQLPDGFAFLSQFGEVHFFDGINMEEVGRVVKDQFANQTENSSLTIMAAYDPTTLRYLIAYDYLVANGFNNRLLEFDTVGKKWDGPHYNGSNMGIGYISIWDSSDDLGEVYYGESNGANGSYVYKRTPSIFVDRQGIVALNAGAGATYESVARTGVYFFDTVGEKKFFKVYCRAKINSGTTIQVRVISDDETSYSIAELFLATVSGANNLLWGVGLWGINNWAGSIISVADNSFPPTARGRRPTFEIRDLSAKTLTKIESLDILTLILEPK